MLIADQGQLGRRYALKVIKREGPEDDVHLALGKAASAHATATYDPATVAAAYAQAIQDLRGHGSASRVSR